MEECGRESRKRENVQQGYSTKVIIYLLGSRQRLEFSAASKAEQKITAASPFLNEQTTLASVAPTVEFRLYMCSFATIFPFKKDNSVSSAQVYRINIMSSDQISSTLRLLLPPRCRILLSPHTPRRM